MFILEEGHICDETSSTLVANGCGRDFYKNLT